MGFGHATTLAYTCVSEDDENDSKFIYSHLPAEEACGEGYRPDTSTSGLIGILIGILCEDSEYPESCKSENIEIILSKMSEDSQLHQN